MDNEKWREKKPFTHNESNHELQLQNFEVMLENLLSKLCEIILIAMQH